MLLQLLYLELATEVRFRDEFRCIILHVVLEH